jgi:hypothetical protein
MEEQNMDDMAMLQEKLDRYPACRVVISREAAARIIARIRSLEESLWDIQEFTRGYGDIAGIVHRKARAALTPPTAGADGGSQDEGGVKP